MAYQSVFRRYELKYLLTREQKDILLETIAPYMSIDNYGRTTIRNIYFDTENYRLIRRSMEKPIYKEKLRIRSYCRADHQSTVFVELKKKYDHVVYKRRTALPEAAAMDWICGRSPAPIGGQIPAEIDYVLQFYGPLRPTVFLTYEREAFYMHDGSDFRVTFDENILCRQQRLDLTEEVGGESILPENQVLMELKCAGGIPLWMAHALSRHRIFKTSFSKYGTAYATLIFPRQLTNMNATKETLSHA